MNGGEAISEKGGRQRVDHRLPSAAKPQPKTGSTTDDADLHRWESARVDDETRFSLGVSVIIGEISGLKSVEQKIPRPPGSSQQERVLSCCSAKTRTDSCEFCAFLRQSWTWL